MSRWNVFGLLLATLLVGVLVAGLVPAASQSGGERFVICEKNGRHDYEADVDSDQDGEFSAGDTFLFAEPEFDTDGKQIGKSAGSGTAVRVFSNHDAIVELDVSLNLKGGRLEVQGAVRASNFGKTPQFPIVGGTGRYAGAGGTITIHEKAGCGGFPKADKLVVELI
jgi:hypothetical protein